MTSIIFRPRFFPFRFPDERKIPHNAIIPHTVLLERYQALKSFWLSVFTHSADHYKEFNFAHNIAQYCDLEEWVENAETLRVLAQTGKPVFVMSRRENVKDYMIETLVKNKNLGHGVILHRLNMEDTTPLNADEPHIRFGLMEPFEDTLDHPSSWPNEHAKSYKSVENYAFNPAFNSTMAGRSLVLTTVRDEKVDKETKPHLPENRPSFESMIHDHGRIVSKIINRHKKPGSLWFSPECLDPTQSDIDQLYFDAYGYNLCQGTTPYILLSEYVTMEKEYRFFFLNGVILCGAGCIDNFSPLYNEGESFSPFVEAKRGEGLISEDPHYVQQAKFFAQDALNGLRAEDPHLLHGTIDVAKMTKGDGTYSLGVIEINPAENAGYYALNLKNFIDPLITHLLKAHQT